MVSSRPLTVFRGGKAGLTGVRFPWSAPMSQNQNTTLEHEERGSIGIAQTTTRLVRPGVSSDTLQAEGIRHLTARQAKALFGQSVACWWIPYYHVDKTPVMCKPIIKGKGKVKPVTLPAIGFGRGRKDEAQEGNKYTQPGGVGAHGYIPRSFKPIKGGILYIPEGEYKTLSMIEAGYCAVGAGGINNCAVKGGSALVPELVEAIKACEPKAVAFVGDADTALIPAFTPSMLQLARLIGQVPLLLPRLPVDAPGKGIDDCREVLKGEFNGWFAAIVDTAVRVNPEDEPSALALELLRREVDALKRLTDKTAVTRENAITRSIKLAAGFDDEAGVRDEIIRIACDTFGIAPDEFGQKVEQATAENAQKRREWLLAKGRERAMKAAGVFYPVSSNLPASAPAQTAPPTQPTTVEPPIAPMKIVGTVAKTKARSVAPLSLPTTPNEWFDHYFPTLKAKYGPAAWEKHRKEDLPLVAAINEDFISATLGLDGSPDEPTIHLPIEDKFFKYEPADGIFRLKEPEQLEGLYSHMLKDCGKACAGAFDVSNLMFSLRKSSKMVGVSRRAKATLHESDEFFDATVKEYIACKNTMLRVSDLQPMPFAPGYHRRNKLGIDYVPGATCERFLNELMRPAMSEDDLDLLQRWSGMALLGENVAQKVMLLQGTAGGGKGAFIRVLTGIIGLENLGELRTKHLDSSRFEVGLMTGKTLLYGADVAADFLSERGAFGLKKITGGDPISPELKNARSTRTFECRFNVVVSANSRLRIRLENDERAWLRRLVTINYTQPPVSKPIPNFDKILLRDEGPGILNWMLEGLKKLAADGWNLTMNAQQKARVENLLLESNNLTPFMRDCLQKDDKVSITVSDTYVVYTEYCKGLDWKPMARYEFGSQIEDAVATQFGVTMRHDVKDASQKAQRGWKGIGLQ